jgi:hypothetical protein
VEKIDNFSALQQYRLRFREQIIIQEYISHPVELGILYYRYPKEDRGRISSVVMKKFLTITGDGKATFEDLVAGQSRALPRMKYLNQKYQASWKEVVPRGKSILLEPIGNHSRGTTFIGANGLINSQLTSVIDKIARGIDGFYYGRFDVKVTSIEDLYHANNLKILELNGVSSEPAHIYDPSYSLFRAYRDVIRHMNIIYRIAKINYRMGCKRSSAWIFFGALIAHFKRVKARGQSFAG